MELGDVVTEEIKKKKYSRSIDVIFNVLPISGSVEEKKEEVIVAADKMPPDYRKIVIKRFVEGKDFESIEKELYGEKPDINKFHFSCQYKNALSMLRVIIDSKINKKSGTELVADLKVNQNFPRKDILYLIDLFKIKYTNLKEYVEKTGIRHNYILKLITGAGMQFIRLGGREIVVIASEEDLSKKVEEKNKHLNDLINKFPDIQNESPLEKEARIRGLIEKLQSPYKEVGKMYYIENKNYKYIADKFGMSQNYIRNWIIIKFDSMIEILTDPEIKNKMNNNFLNYLNKKIKTGPKSGISLHIAELLGMHYQSFNSFINKNKYNEHIVHYLTNKKIIEIEKLGNLRYIKNPEKASKEIGNFYEKNLNLIKFAKNFNIPASTVHKYIKQYKINTTRIGGGVYINLNDTVGNIINLYKSTKNKGLKEFIIKIFSKNINYAVNNFNEIPEKEKEALSNFGKEALFKLIKNIDCPKNLYDNLSKRLYYTIINVWMADKGTTIKREYTK